MVDVDTKVYGTDNLFVVDASILPGQVTTNPSSYVVIAAERASERILALPAPTPVPQYGQCGGRNWAESFQCEAPYTCTYDNDYYWEASHVAAAPWPAETPLLTTAICSACDRRLEDTSYVLPGILARGARGVEIAASLHAASGYGKRARDQRATEYKTAYSGEAAPAGGPTRAVNTPDAVGALKT